MKAPFKKRKLTDITLPQIWNPDCLLAVAIHLHNAVLCPICLSKLDPLVDNYYHDENFDLLAFWDCHRFDWVQITTNRRTGEFVPVYFVKSPAIISKLTHYNYRWVFKSHISADLPKRHFQMHLTECVEYRCPYCRCTWDSGWYPVGLSVSVKKMIRKNPDLELHMIEAHEWMQDHWYDTIHTPHHVLGSYKERDLPWISEETGRKIAYQNTTDDIIRKLHKNELSLYHLDKWGLTNPNIWMEERTNNRLLRDSLQCRFPIQGKR